MFLELESNISQETCYIICFFMEIRSYKKRGTNYHWVSELAFESLSKNIAIRSLLHLCIVKFSAKEMCSACCVTFNITSYYTQWKCL